MSEGLIMSEASQRMKAAASAMVDASRSADGAADTMTRAVAAFAEVVARFELAVAVLGEIEAMKALNMQRAALGHSMAYDDGPFMDVVKRLG